jgi:serine/threonine protein kinase
MRSPGLRTIGTGDTIGGYRLLEEIGEGGGGRVFRAEQQQPFQREVALKLSKSTLAAKDEVARFKAEVQALANLNHPNIAKVFGADTSNPKCTYFTMELVLGQKITDYADLHRLDIKARLELFVRVCGAAHPYFAFWSFAQACHT